MARCPTKFLFFQPFLQLEMVVWLCSAVLANETRKAVLWESSGLGPTDLAFLPSCLELIHRVTAFENVFPIHDSLLGFLTSGWWSMEQYGPPSQLRTWVISNYSFAYFLSSRELLNEISYPWWCLMFSLWVIWKVCVLFLIPTLLWKPGCGSLCL